MAVRTELFALHGHGAGGRAVTPEAVGLGDVLGFLTGVNEIGDGFGGCGEDVPGAFLLRIKALPLWACRNFPGGASVCLCCLLCAALRSALNGKRNQAWPVLCKSQPVEI